MNIQRVLLRVMLASLAIAAAVGAMAALTNQTEMFWRIIGTCVLTSVVAGMLIPLSRHLDKDRSRPAALTAVAGIVIEFIYILALIWRVLEAVFVFHSGELAATACLFVPVAAAAAIFVYMLGTSSTRWAGICGLVLDAPVFVLATIASWSSWQVSEKYAGAAGAIAIFGAMIVACLIGLGSGDRRWWRWIGIAAAVVAMSINVYAIWNHIFHPDWGFAVIDSIGALVAFANVLMLAELKGSQIWARRIAIGAAAITATFIDLEFYMVKSGNFGHDDPLSRIASAGGIITGCSAVGVAILVALNRKSKPKPVATNAIKDITVICPLCQKKLTVMLDTPGQCACGLKMTVQIEEPHCTECGYLLIGLTSDRCPECGTIINPAAQAQSL